MPVTETIEEPGRMEQEDGERGDNTQPVNVIHPARMTGGKGSGATVNPAHSNFVD